MGMNDFETKKGNLTNMVVLVDDEPNIRETVAFILEAEGVEVETGSDGVEGLEAVRRCRPKVVLLDVMMPRMDGYEVCKAIRNDADLSGVFVMILTARGQKSDEEKALENFRQHLFEGQRITEIARNLQNGAQLGLRIDLHA